jgi:hypothetical protein
VTPFSILGSARTSVHRLCNQLCKEFNVVFPLGDIEFANAGIIKGHMTFYLDPPRHSQHVAAYILYCADEIDRAEGVCLHGQDLKGVNSFADTVSDDLCKALKESVSVVAGKVRLPQPSSPDYSITDKGTKFTEAEGEVGREVMRCFWAIANRVSFHHAFVDALMRPAQHCSWVLPRP